MGAVEPESPETPESTQLPLATIWRRVGANVVDGLVIAVALLLVAALLGDLSIEAMRESAGLQISAWLMGVTYQVVLIAQTGQTVGKRLLSIQAVDATTGAIPTTGQSARRAIGHIVAPIPFIGFLGGLLPVPALWHPRRQGLHDRFANTVVIDRSGLA
jgi:uncharacterized RDD family membrane protein YckC